MTANDCRDCPQGKISAPVGKCEMCTTGKYTNSAGQSVCTECGAGRYTSHEPRTATLKNTKCMQNLEPPNVFSYHNVWEGRSYYKATGYDADKLMEYGYTSVFLFYHAAWKGWIIGPQLGNEFSWMNNAGKEDQMHIDKLLWKEYCVPGGRRRLLDHGAEWEDTEAVLEFSAPKSGLDCLVCDAGKYSAILGASTASTCVACSAGKYSATPGAITASTCLACSGGMISNLAGSTVCVGCGEDTFSNLDATTCIECPRGAKAAVKSTSLSDCLCEKDMVKTRQTETFFDCTKILVKVESKNG